METISDIRKALGMTQAELAAALGMNQASISRMEAGTQPTDQRTMIAARAILREQTS